MIPDFTIFENRKLFPFHITVHADGRAAGIYIDADGSVSGDTAGARDIMRDMTGGGLDVALFAAMLRMDERLTQLEAQP